MSTLTTASPVQASEVSVPSPPSPQGPSVLQLIARSLLLLGLFAAPWAYGAVRPWAWGGLAVLAWLTLFVWVLACVQRGRIRLLGSPLYWLFLGLLVLAALQFAAGWTYDHVATREAVIKISTDLLLFFLAGQLFNTLPENGRALRWLGFTASVLCVAVSTLALAQFFTSTRAIYWRVVPPIGWPFGPYVNHNHYGGLMEMLIPLSAGYLFSRRTTSTLRYFLWLLLAFPVVSVLFSESRGATASIVIEGLILAALIAFKSPRSVRAGAVVLGGLAAGLALGIFLWLNSGHVPARLQTMLKPQAEMHDRLAVSRVALRMFASHPILGVGMGCYEYAFPAYVDFVTELHWTHAHNDYAELLAEAGVPAGLLMLAGLVVFLRSGFRHLKDRLRHESGWIQVGAAVSCAGLLCHSFVDFNLRIAANAAWFVVCLAVAVHPRSGQGAVRKNSLATSGAGSGKAETGSSLGEAPQN